MNVRGMALLCSLLTSTLLAACASNAPGSGETAERVSSAGVGESCTLAEEANASFAGYSADEVVVESQSRSCQTELCLSYRFQGRQTCPYGENCTTTAGAAVTAAVEPQLLARSPDDSVYCSCRCDGPEGTGPFCECPEAFECRPVVDDFGVASSGGEDLVGSYCVKRGTYVESSASLAGGPECDAALANCEDR